MIWLSFFRLYTGAFSFVVHIYFTIPPLRRIPRRPNDVSIRIKTCIKRCGIWVRRHTGLGLLSSNFPRKCWKLSDERLCHNKYDSQAVSCMFYNVIFFLKFEGIARREKHGLPTPLVALEQACHLGIYNSLYRREDSHSRCLLPSSLSRMDVITAPFSQLIVGVEHLWVETGSKWDL